MANVSLRNLRKVFPGDQGKDVVAVDDLNLEIANKEFMVIVGSSGCGKSTTLRMIAGLEEITSGELFIGDRKVNDVPPKDRDIAMVFQNYALYPHMSVRENLAFGLKIRKYPRAEINKRVTEAADLLGIADLLDRKPKALSGGQRQRVAVGRAIVRQPKVFLFDEPLSNLDAKMRAEMRAELTKLHQRLQATIIYVTHDQVEAMTMASRIVVLNHGVVQQVDQPLSLYHEPKNLFVAGFLGSPQMNFIRGTLSGSANAISFKESDSGTILLQLGYRPAAAPFIGREVTLGIRPEHCNPIPHDTPKAANQFPAVIDLVEPMGSETYFHVTTGPHHLISRSHDALDHTASARRMRIQVDPSRVHLFDPKSTNRIA